ncbi:unnamed protein product, partial [Rotaria sp. Silwood2]
HDAAIQRWALSQAKTGNLHNFTASHHWLLNFKRRNGITSRKVTKFISRREFIDNDVIANRGDKFVKEVA